MWGQVVNVKMNNSVKDSENTIPDNFANPVSGVEVLGRDEYEVGKFIVVVKRYGSPNHEAFTFYSRNLIKGNHRNLAELLLDAGINSPIDRDPVAIQKDIASQFNFVKEKLIIFIDNAGAHQRYIKGESCIIFVINGEFYLISQTIEKPTIILSGNARKKHEKKEGYQRFIEDFSEKLALQPRLLLVILFSLTSYWWSVFGVSPLALMLVGKTSSGKSICQRLASLLVTGNQQMISGNFTEIGLHDELASRGTQPVFIEDGHGKTVAQAMISAFMDAGNKARRVRSKRTQHGSQPAKPVTATLIVSAEQDLSKTAQDAKLRIMPGVHSRVFEMFVGELGMFDDLCGFEDGAKLANYFDSIGADHPGILGEMMVRAICENFEYYKKSWKGKKEDINKKICEHVKVAVDWDGQDKRLFDGLVFCAYIGRIAIREKILVIKIGDIHITIGRIFDEYLSRKYSRHLKQVDELNSSVVYVRNVLQRYMGKIKTPQTGVRLRLQLSNSEIIGFDVYEKCGRYYLIKPEAFKKIMGDRLSQKTYLHLKEAGFLKVSENRGNQYQKRLSDEHRESFVAISASIMD